MKGLCGRVAYKETLHTCHVGSATIAFQHQTCPPWKKMCDSGVEQICLHNFAGIRLFSLLLACLLLFYFHTFTSHPQAVQSHLWSKQPSPPKGLTHSFGLDNLTFILHHRIHWHCESDWPLITEQSVLGLWHNLAGHYFFGKGLFQRPMECAQRLPRKRSLFARSFGAVSRIPSSTS